MFSKLLVCYSKAVFTKDRGGGGGGGGGSIFKSIHVSSVLSSVQHKVEHAVCALCAKVKIIPAGAVPFVDITMNTVIANHTFTLKLVQVSNFMHVV